MERILLIEDNKTISRQVRIALENEDFSVTSCFDYGETEKKIIHGSYFVAIVDMEIPDAPWQKTVDLMNRYDIPVVIYSSCNYTPELREELQSKKVLDFISKNIKQSLEDLVYTVKRLRLNQDIKIMIVDDSKSARRLGRFVLEQTKFNVFEAGDGLEALGVLEANPDMSIIVTDFEMPHMNGYELVKIIREQYDKNRLAVIAFSHPSTTASSATFLKYGANDFIRKPYSNEEFYCRVITQAELLEAFAKVSNLNEQKNNLIGMVAHDIRVPLANIEMICNKLLDKSREEYSDKIAKALTAISQTSSKMMILLNDLLNITSLERGKNKLDLKENSLRVLVEDRLDSVFYREAEKKDISLILKAEETPLVPFDINRISQVVDNLISNALKFTPRGGDVIINIKNKKGRQVFRIWDNGPGLNHYDLDHAFLEFQKLSAKPTGGESSTGLGLAICKKIITMHRGRIWINSEPGKGAEFCFSLPRI